MKFVFTAALVHMVCALAGFIALLARIPLPWLIGSIVAASLLSIRYTSIKPAMPLRKTGQLLIGATMGLHLAPEAALRIVDAALPIALATILTVSAAMLLGLIQSRFFKANPVTAVYSTVPGGPVEMATMAQAQGGDPAQAALSQSIRIIFIVCLFPPLLQLAASPEIVPARAFDTKFEPLALPGLIAACAAAAYVATLLRLLNPFFLGPLLLVGALTAANVALPAIPYTIVAMAQVFLGASIGQMLDRNMFANGAVATLSVAASSFLLFGICIIIAWTLHIFFKLDLLTMILALAPGSAPEMAIAAEALSTDVPLVVAFHMARVIFVASLLPVIVAIFRAIA